MNHQFFKLFAALLFVIFISCDKEETPKPLPEEGYPTTYEVLSQNEWDVVDAEFQKINSYKGLQLNKNGFVYGEVRFENLEKVSKDFILSTIDSLLLNYGGFMGLPPDKSFNLENDLSFPVFATGGQGYANIDEYFELLENYGDHALDRERYICFLYQNRINTKFTIGLSIRFHFNQDENKLQLSGNWVPDAIVPQTKIYSEEEAYEIARKEVKHRLDEDVEFEKNELNIYSALFKSNNNGDIEIRDCWRIGKLDYVGGYAISVFVDSQTGEVVSFTNK